MTNAAAALLLLVSGVYYPIAVLPGWLQWIARGSPATYVIDQMRACLLHRAPTASLLSTVFPLIGAGCGVIAIGLVVFRHVERYAKQTGRLKRSG